MDEFDDFYRDRAAAMRRYAVALVGPVDADDSCQEAWSRIWRAWDEADPERRDAWAFRIVRNCCIDRRRRAKPVAELEESRLPPVPGVDTVVIDRLEADAALDLLARLPVRLREALWLREVAGMSYAEIAEVQQVPIGTVMSRLHAGRRKVARELGREGR